MSCGNPLFLKWVKEFHSEKDYKKRGGPPRATGYEKAIWALQGCSESYEHPKELLKLDGIGPTCVKRLTEKLEAYCDQRGIPMPEYKPPPRKKAAPRKKKAEPLPPGTRRNLVKIVEADVEDYPRPATFSASTSQARNPPRKSVTKRHYSDDDDEEEEEGDSDDWEREDLLPENEVWAAPSGRPNAVRRTKQVARRPLPQKRTQAAPAKANEEVIELSDDSENERMPLSDESSEVDVKSKTQQKRKATEVDEEEEEEEVVEEEEEYAPVQSRKKIPHHELARMAAARRRGEPVKRRKI